MFQEKPIKVWSGYGPLALFLFFLLIVAPLIFFSTVVEQQSDFLTAVGIIAVILVILGSVLGLVGLFIVMPNQARVITLFGEYKGTVKEPGFFWANPFYYKPKVSLRVRTFETGNTTTTAKSTGNTGVTTEVSTKTRNPTKVNDLLGNPIEIAAVVVWQVRDTVEALFHIDNYEEFVHVQSESALRNMASKYPYDLPEDGGVSLRGSTTHVGEELRKELQDRLKQAGVEALEARISYLAYAPEIAAAMLQRQQATAILAARKIIVEGAVGMVEMALERLEAHNTVKLDEDRKAAMVSNLLVVLCGERAAQPILNTGTIHH
ncbi:MAG: SPFH domain-containing protein [Gemmataceae bacterium]|nr:SPFH domain-containing protein [Gemmataceae bacterium]